jgi:hypothetical protein
MKMITSRKAENKILALETEIARLKRKQIQIKEGFSWNEEKAQQVSELEDAVRQIELEKQCIEVRFVAELAAALSQANGKAWAWTISAEDLIDLAHESEDHLDTHGVRVKHRPGAKVEFRPAGKVSRSQLGMSITTRVVMRRVQDGWRLVYAERDHCFANQNEFKEITVKPAAYDDMIRHATRNVRVWKKASPKKPPEAFAV